MSKPILSKQNQTILELLQRGTTLTNKVALVCYGIGSLTSRIAELRRAGFPIKTRKERDQDGRTFKKYNLETN